jgi:hypothetical protein
MARDGGQITPFYSQVSRLASTDCLGQFAKINARQRINLALGARFRAQVARRGPGKNHQLRVLLAHAPLTVTIEKCSTWLCHAKSWQWHSRSQHQHRLAIRCLHIRNLHALVPHRHLRALIKNNQIAFR